MPATSSGGWSGSSGSNSHDQRKSGSNSKGGGGTQLIPCKFYKSGTCSAGRNCQFLHTKDDALQLCKFFLKGNCKFGNKCALSHGEQDTYKQIDPPPPVPNRKNTANSGGNLNLSVSVVKTPSHISLVPLPPAKQSPSTTPVHRSPQMTPNPYSTTTVIASVGGTGSSGSFESKQQPTITMTNLTSPHSRPMYDVPSVTSILATMDQRLKLPEGAPYESLPRSQMGVSSSLARPSSLPDFSSLPSAMNVHMNPHARSLGPSPSLQPASSHPAVQALSIVDDASPILPSSLSHLLTAQEQQLLSPAGSSRVRSANMLVSPSSVNGVPSRDGDTHVDVPAFSLGAPMHSLPLTNGHDNATAMPSSSSFRNQSQEHDMYYGLEIPGSRGRPKLVPLSHKAQTTTTMAPLVSEPAHSGGMRVSKEMSFAAVAKSNTWLDPYISYSTALGPYYDHMGPHLNADPSGDDDGELADDDPSIYDDMAADEQLCPYHANGHCRYGDECSYLHGLPCPKCHQNVIHPLSASANQRHLEACTGPSPYNNDTELDSAQLECAICLELVLSKADSRFGLLDCDHIFCLQCIRNWRTTITGSADSTTVHRSCPLCRVVSHVVVPSLRFYASGPAKEAVMSAYKVKLGTINCKYFNYGEGTCPFGTSCFYAHAYRDGSREQVRLRKYITEDEEVRFMTGVKLSDFIIASDLKRSGAIDVSQLPTH